MMKLISKLGITALLAGLLPASLLLNATESNLSANIISVTNPSNTFGVQIGDRLNRTVVLDVPVPLKIADTGFPKRGAKNNGVELVSASVMMEQQKKVTRYTVDLAYQAFNTPGKPQVMYLPVEKFNVTDGLKSEVLELPAWSFWFSPIVTGNIATAKSNIQPDALPPMVDVAGHKARLTLFAGLLVSSLMVLLYMNADCNWLPFMGGAFARAHRQLKRLAKSKGEKTMAEEKRALVYIHQAFNHHFGANMFARDIESFVAKRSSFKKMRSEIAEFFNQSNQSLYTIEPRNTQKMIIDLLHLSKQLRDCERGV